MPPTWYKTKEAMQRYGEPYFSAMERWREYSEALLENRLRLLETAVGLLNKYSVDPSNYVFDLVCTVKDNPLLPEVLPTPGKAYQEGGDAKAREACKLLVPAPLFIKIGIFFESRVLKALSGWNEAALQKMNHANRASIFYALEKLFRVPKSAGVCWFVCKPLSVGDGTGTAAAAVAGSESTAKCVSLDAPLSPAAVELMNRLRDYLEQKRRINPQQCEDGRTVSEDGALVASVETGTAGDGDDNDEADEGKDKAVSEDGALVASVETETAGDGDDDNYEADEGKDNVVSEDGALVAAVETETAGDDDDNDEADEGKNKVVSEDGALVASVETGTTGDGYDKDETDEGKDNAVSEDGALVASVETETAGDGDDDNYEADEGKNKAMSEVNVFVASAETGTVGTVGDDDEAAVAGAAAAAAAAAADEAKAKAQRAREAKIEKALVEAAKAAAEAVEAAAAKKEAKARAEAEMAAKNINSINSGSSGQGGVKVGGDAVLGAWSTSHKSIGSRVASFFSVPEENSSGKRNGRVVSKIFSGSVIRHRARSSARKKDALYHIEWEDGDKCVYNETEYELFAKLYDLRFNWTTNHSSVGKKVAAYFIAFRKTPFAGSCVRYLAATSPTANDALYHIIFEDGDECDYNEGEFKQAVALYEKISSAVSSSGTKRNLQGSSSGANKRSKSNSKSNNIDNNNNNSNNNNNKANTSIANKYEDGGNGKTTAPAAAPYVEEGGELMAADLAAQRNEVALITAAFSDGPGCSVGGDDDDGINSSGEGAAAAAAAAGGGGGSGTGN